jgi:hypothetical protein
MPAPITAKPAPTILGISIIYTLKINFSYSAFGGWLLAYCLKLTAFYS